jgi:hypothetical protein
MRFSREADAAYLAAVEAGEEWKAERMVRDAALTWGAATNEEGKPLDLYHGTPSFGFTTFDNSGRQTATTGLIYTSTKREVNANYAGRENYAGVRQIGRRFIEGATKTGDIIKNACAGSFSRSIYAASAAVCAFIFFPVRTKKMTIKQIAAPAQVMG